MVATPNHFKNRKASGNHVSFGNIECKLHRFEYDMNSANVLKHGGVVLDCLALMWRDIKNPVKDVSEIVSVVYNGIDIQPVVYNHFDFIQEVEAHCTALGNLAYGTLCLPDLPGLLAEKKQIEHRWDAAIGDERYEAWVKMTVYEASFKNRYCYMPVMEACTMEGRAVDPEHMMDFVYGAFYGQQKFEVAALEKCCIESWQQERLLGIAENHLI